MSPDRDEDRIRSQRPEPAPPPPRERFDDEEPPARPSSGGNPVKIVLIVVGAVVLAGICVIGGVFGLLFYSTTKVRDAAMRMKITNNHKQVALAMHNYASRHGDLPPVAMKTSSGKPGLSWRVAILPYLEQESLYRQFKLDEPWNHPDNLKLASQMPVTFLEDRASGGDHTHMRLFIGGGAAFDMNRPISLERVTAADGVANTIMIVESAQAVLWIQPDELMFDPKGPLPSLGLPDNDYFLATMFDGSVHRYKKTASPEKIKAAITFDGGERVSLPEEQ